MSEEAKVEQSGTPALATHIGNAGNKGGRGRLNRVRESNRKAGSGGFFQPLPAWVWMASVFFALCGFLTANPTLTVFAILVVPVVLSLLWFEGNASVLLFACIMQWLQVVTAIFFTDFMGTSLEDAFDGPELAKAAGLSLFGILALAIGMRVALLGKRVDIKEVTAQEAQTLNTSRVFIMYLITFFLFSFVFKLAEALPSIRQPLEAIATIRWVAVFFLAYVVLLRRDSYKFLVMAVLLELAVGFTGYFGGFRSILFVVVVALLGTRFKFTGWRLFEVCMVLALTLVLCLVWMSIREEYRMFLNKGSGQQEVLVPVSERFVKLGELVGNLDRNTFEEGLELVIMRVSYITYFAHTIRNVPANVPHENGSLWFGSIMHVLKPRLLFPNKPEIQDSERTAYYSGVKVAGAEEGTSIGLGYMGESYIDFGSWGMFVPIFVLGLFYGMIFRYFTFGTFSHLLGLSIAVAILLPAHQAIAMSNIKLIGGNITVCLVMFMFCHFFGRGFVRALTQIQSTRRDRPRSTKSRRERFQN